MAVWKLLINFGLLFIATAIFSVDEGSAINYRLPDNVVPTHYSIKLIPHIEEEILTFDGESNINITIRHATQNLSLHMLELVIDGTVTSLFDINNNNVYIPAMYNYNDITQILVIHFNDELSPGNYTLKMRYVGTIHYDLEGFFLLFYINEEGNNVWLAATQFEPTFARRAFPCWDEPALKATFDISIKHHRNYTALSNMPIQKQWDDNEDGMIWTHFDTTPIMSTYLVAFVVIDYVRVPTEDETINIWCRSKLVPDIKFAQEIIQKSKRLLTEYTNSISTVPKMDFVALPQYTNSPTKNWGLIIFAETSFAYNESFNTVSTKLNIAATTVHKMAHQWLSNVVTPLWWSHLWLSEGFATFFEIYILNRIFEEWRITEYFVVNIQQTILYHDINTNIPTTIIPTTLEVNRPDEIKLLVFGTSYRKTPAILRMLQHIITNKVFQNGLIKYLHKHQFNSATPDDFWNILQTVLDKSDVPHNAYRLKEVMDTWLKQSGFPEVHVTRNNDTNKIILTQEYFIPINESADNKWWIPLTFATQTNPDFSNTVPTHWLKPQDQNITIDGIDPNDWIIVNLQQMGFYRVNYDSSVWHKIAHFLKSDSYMKIHVLNRAQIIDDAYYFMMKDKHNTVIFLHIVSYLSQETDFMPWLSMFKILKRMENIYKIPENLLFKSYVLKIFDGLIENVGYEESPTESDLMKIKRSEALKWACTLGHSECKRMATVKLNKYFTDPETHKISPNLKDWTYCNGLMEANISTWNKLYDIYVNKSDRDALSYLFCSENPDIIINFLNISVPNKSLKKIFDYFVIYSSIIRRHAKNKVVVDYILTNYERIIPRNYNINRALDDIIKNMYSKEKLDEISEFVRNKFGEKVFKQIQDKIIKRKELLNEYIYIYELVEYFDLIT